jgi:hypothetical protein
MSSVTIQVKGYGHEFQWHRVSKDTLKEMLNNYKEGGIESLMDIYFSGGSTLDGQEFGGYGCDIDSTIRVDGEDIEVSNKNLIASFDDAKPNIEGADFYYISQGQIEGAGEISLKSGKFDPNLLTVDYIEFNVMRSGSLITCIKYDGEVVDIEFEDSGVDYRHQLLTYDADDEGNVGVFTTLFYSEDDDEFKFIADDVKQLLKKK